MGPAHDLAILGAGVRPADAAMRTALLAQDGLSTVLPRGPQGQRARRTGAMIGFVPVPPDNAPLIAAMAGPRIRIAHPAGCVDQTPLAEAMARPRASAFLRKVAGKDIRPVVPPVPGATLPPTAIRSRRGIPTPASRTRDGGSASTARIGDRSSSCLRCATRGDPRAAWPRGPCGRGGGRDSRCAPRAPPSRQRRHLAGGGRRA